MALTARATEPVTWGEGIVPVLRKRLEHESRALSKRLSQTTTPDEVQANSGQERTSHVSHIPKPSIHSLSSEGAPRRTRPRTHSQPRLFDRDMLTPASSRSQSPAVPVANSRPSRIPTRPRAGSRSIPAAELPPSPDPSPDLWPVPENIIRTELTPPTPERSDHRRKRDTFVPPPPDDNEETLFDEPAPFTINANSLAGRSSIDEYEHWYRGEGRAGGGRNGGRGEIRIATRTEMLEIASFGHPPSRNNSHGHGYGDFGWRNKAYDDSTIGTRFRWPDENGENVLDEAPLTDLDDMDTDSYHPGSQEARSIEVRSIESYQPPDVRSEHTMEDVRSVELEPEPDGRPDPVTPKPSRIARAVSPPVGPGASTASLVSRPGRSPTPSKALSTASKSPPPRAQSPKVKSPKVQSPKVQSPKAQSPKPAQTPKAKSPARRTNTTTPKPPRAGTSQLTPKPGTPKTPRIGASPGRNNTSPSPRPRAQSTSTKSNGTRRTQKLSTGEDPGVHSLADAIPQIPPDQPNDGNWDDVVLPAIARKMQGGDVSLMGRELREVEEEPIPPAPGTFGYRERQKDKERKDQRRVSGTEMEEFGAREPVRKVKTVEKAEEKKKAEERAKAPSPPPFSDYTPIPPVIKPPEPVPAPVVQPMTISEGDLRQNMSSKDSHDAGCCKCVVM